MAQDNPNHKKISSGRPPCGAGAALEGRGLNEAIEFPTTFDPHERTTVMPTPWKKFLLASAALALGLALFPQPASAVDFAGKLTHSSAICIHRSGCYEQVHPVYLQSGKTYTITLISKDFDTYLFLE